MVKPPIIETVRSTAKKKILFLPHAIRQMSRPERMITSSEVEEVVQNGEIIEDYPEDKRGGSCLILGVGESSRPIHIVCSPKDDYLTIITAYIPNDEEWTNDYQVRRKK